MLGWAVPAAWLLSTRGPIPSADVSRASETAFATGGLQPREFLPPLMAPARWTAGRSSYRFERLPPGLARLDVGVWGHHARVRVSASGVELGHVAAGEERAAYQLTVPRDGVVEVALDVEPFAAGLGRRLGTQLREVTLTPSQRHGPSLALAALLAAPAAAILTAGFICGASIRVAIGLSGAATTALTLLLWCGGLAWSPYATRLTLGLSVVVVLVGPLARRFRAPPFAFAALLSALIVQGALTTHPLLISFDETFHSNRLASVARGELLQTSLTQHDPPIAFPYGFKFYALLTPFVGPAGSLIDTVRIGAAASGVIGVMATYAIAARASALHGLGAALLLQLLPWSFVVFPNGNLSNVFGQAIAVAFLAWWSRPSPAAWPIGAALLAVSCLAHLSSLFVLTTFIVVAFLMSRFDRRPFGKQRVFAAIVGLAVTVGYYSLFIPLALEQAPRLVAGGSGAESALGEAAWGQLRDAALLLGAPALALAWVGRPREGGEPNAGLR